MAASYENHLNDAVAKATAEANEVFGRLGNVISRRSQEKGASSLNVLEIAREAGLEIDDRTLEELQIDRIIPVYPWLPWYIWWPWRPLWCWWWRRHYPWYRYWPYWWHRCHWHCCC